VRRTLQRTSGRIPSSYDANLPVPEHLTHELFQRIEKLPDCPKVRYLKEQVKSKFVSSDTDPASVRRQRAINKWLAVERDNEATNVRLLMLNGDYNILPRVTWDRFLTVCRDVVCDVIGEVPPEDTLIGAFSGGASTSRSRASSHPAGKYLGQADITPAALDWFELSLESIPAWASFKDDVSINVVPGNVLFTVPKNTEIDRVAAKEPDLNMFLQKGVGDSFRRSLKRRGIDLNDQSKNRELARLGSLSGSLATLDLSSASDSVSCSLVELLLPPLWFSLLNSLRSPVTMIDGEEHSNEMFSSMGNGFTFELESLLFYSIARSCAYLTGTSGVISVYGDDIIVPHTLAEDLMWVLSVLGFSVNPEKSFWTGSFRESCGGHYDSGYDITPFYVRKPLSRLTDVIHVANAIRRWSIVGGIGVLDPTMLPIWEWLKGFVPEQLWGGHELESITQLVVPCEPRRRLIAKTRTRQVEARGGYLHWLNTTWARGSASDHIVTSELTHVGTQYRMRPARKSSCHSITPFHIEV